MKNWQGKFGPLLIAEIGGNHEGDFPYAQKLTGLAIESGADVVKFQIYTGDTLVNKVESPERNNHFKKFELLPDQHIALAKQCREAGVQYMASVWDVEALGWIDEYIDIYKVGSGDLTAYPILDQIIALNKPIIISTGLADASEVAEAVEYFKQSNDFYSDPNNLAVLQCTSMYPINPCDANLNVMNFFKEILDVSVGYSDHTEGSVALEVAVAMGAQVLEFHFTDEREGKVFRDHKVSLTCKEVQGLIRKIELINTLKGSSVKCPLPIEIENGHPSSFRRATYLRNDMSKGDIVRPEDLICLRPNHGIDARNAKSLIGKKLTKDLKALNVLSVSDFE